MKGMGTWPYSHCHPSLPPHSHSPKSNVQITSPTSPAPCCEFQVLILPLLWGDADSLGSLLHYLGSVRFLSLHYSGGNKAQDVGAGAAEGPAPAPVFTLSVPAARLPLAIACGLWHVGSLWPPEPAPCACEQRDELIPPPASQGKPSTKTAGSWGGHAAEVRPADPSRTELRMSAALAGVIDALYRFAYFACLTFACPCVLGSSSHINPFPRVILGTA